MALIGLPGAGKSTVGRILAARLGWPFHDLDAGIEAAAGRTVAEIFEHEGETGFRQRESRMLSEIDGEGTVVACGGGVVVEPGNRALLKERFITAWLEVEPAEAARRLAHGAESRPLLRDGTVAGRLQALLREREFWYREVSSLALRTDGLDPETLVEPLFSILHVVP
jgi:shikimate kinase